jgi:predicted restriction endonuclease
MQHYSNSMLLPFEKIVSQSKYQELFSKSFEDIAMEFTKITDYTEPYSILRKLNQNLFSLLQKGEHEIALPLKLIKPISEISKVPIMDIFEELEQLDVSIQDKIKNEDIISESYFDRLLYTGLL